MAIYDKPATVFVASFMGSPPMNLLNLEFNHSDRTLYFSHKQKVLTLPENHLLMRSNASILTLGLRPEHLNLVQGEGMFSLQVELIESLGADLYLCGPILGDETGRLHRVRRTHTDFLPRVGEVVSLDCDLKHLHFFDSVTGQRFNG
jgi:sn-glycerol 3-phosphate transport system ATP-binding protein